MHRCSVQSPNLEYEMIDNSTPNSTDSKLVTQQPQTTDMVSHYNSEGTLDLPYQSKAAEYSTPDYALINSLVEATGEENNYQSLLELKLYQNSDSNSEYQTLHTSPCYSTILPLTSLKPKNLDQT